MLRQQVHRSRIVSLQLTVVKASWIHRLLMEIRLCGRLLELSSILTLIFSSPGQSPGRAIVLLPASALAAASALAKW